MCVNINLKQKNLQNFIFVKSFTNPFTYKMDRLRISIRVRLRVRVTVKSLSYISSKEKNDYNYNFYFHIQSIHLFSIFILLVLG